MNKVIRFTLGSFVLIVGISLILVWWSDVISFLKGTIGFCVSIAGMLIMYSLNKGGGKKP